MRTGAERDRNDVMSQAAELSRADAAAAPAIVLERVNKWFGSLHVLRDVSLTVRQGERVVVCGPSGSGKSTLIRCINRLEEHQEGHIIIDGTELTGDLRSLDTIRREVGMVFQRSNPFPKSIFENVAFGLRIAGVSDRRLVAQAVERALQAMEQRLAHLRENLRTPELRDEFEKANQFRRN